MSLQAERHRVGQKKLVHLLLCLLAGKRLDLHKWDFFFQRLFTGSESVIGPCASLGFGGKPEKVCSAQVPLIPNKEQMVHRIAMPWVAAVRANRSEPVGIWTPQTNGTRAGDSYPRTCWSRPQSNSVRTLKTEPSHPRASWSETQSFQLKKDTNSE